MSGSILQSLLASPWSLVVAGFCLTLSIFVHELGHFLAARLRGFHVERFSIFGLGRPIVSWQRGGVEWCVCWIPFGAYVALPQLVDLGELEGGSSSPETRKLPPMGYLDKVIVSVAGPFFNVLLALLLATVLWQIGEKTAATSQTTTIGHVNRSIDESGHPSPALEAGLQAGDVIRTVDGRSVAVWDDVVQSLVMGGGMATDGQRSAVFAIERAGKLMTITVHPKLATEEKIRRIGISPAGGVIVATVQTNKNGAKAGFQSDDRIETIDGTRIWGPGALDDFFTANATRALRFGIRRGQTALEIVLPPGSVGPDESALGITWTTDITTIHIDPFTQVGGQIRSTYRTIWSLVNPSSDIGLSKMSGPLGIITVFAYASIAGLVPILSVTILINIALAVFNLLPIPVLDGGQIVFATIAKLRGRPLPINVIANLQVVFILLLFSMMAYVSVNDARRIFRDNRPAAEAKPAAPEVPVPAPAAPAPAKP